MGGQIVAASEQAKVHVLIQGRVQGVGYRFWTADEADRRGLAGWVRNKADGSVEATFGGPADAVAEMIAACWRGPGLARVSAVEQGQAEDEDLPDPFQIRR
jgi:acylphosphatase